MTLLSSTIGSFRHLLMLTIMVILFMLLLPVIIPLVAFMHWRNDTRMRLLAAEMHCTRCGRLMGPNAPKLADRAWNAEANAIKKRLPPRIIPRIERKVHAICPNCGLHYRYQEEFGRFVSETR